MAILKIEVDTNDIFDERSFEDVVTKNVKKEISDIVFAKISKDHVDAIVGEVSKAIDAKLMNLINEDIAITDRWGKPTFIGSVEDYIKKQIDEKMLSPVDSRGNVIKACAGGDNETWINHELKKSMAAWLERIKNDFTRSSEQFCKKQLSESIKEYQETTLKGLIMKSLEAVGIK